MTSIALTPAEHQVFTNEWRRLIPYGKDGTGKSTAGSVLEKAKEVYADYPDILKALGLGS